jgi:integrase
MIKVRVRDVSLALSILDRPLRPLSFGGLVRNGRPDAGIRQIDLLPALRDELAAHKAQAARIAPDDYVFATARGSEPKQSNIRRRVFGKAATRANEQLIEAGEVPLPEGLTPHKLRHTFASILVAPGVDPGSVMDQLGHADPGFTLRVYRHGMRRDPAAKERLRELVGGVDWAPLGTGAQNGALPVFMAARPSTPIPA